MAADGSYLNMATTSRRRCARCSPPPASPAWPRPTTSPASRAWPRVNWLDMYPSPLEGGVFAGFQESQMDVKDKIRDQVTNHPVVLYMKGTPQTPMCGFSATATQLLKLSGASN